MKKQLFVILILCAALMFTLSGTALAAQVKAVQPLIQM